MSKKAVWKDRHFIFLRLTLIYYLLYFYLCITNIVSKLEYVSILHPFDLYMVVSCLTDGAVGPLIEDLVTLSIAFRNLYKFVMEYEVLIISYNLGVVD